MIRKGVKHSVRMEILICNGLSMQMEWIAATQGLSMLSEWTATMEGVKPSDGMDRCFAKGLACCWKGSLLALD